MHKAWLLILILVTVVFAVRKTHHPGTWMIKIYSDAAPTSQEIQELVLATMAINPWPEKALPPGAVVKVPLYGGLRTEYVVISKWGNEFGLPDCYWSACHWALHNQETRRLSTSLRSRDAHRVSQVR
jgi:hypothetical protein